MNNQIRWVGLILVGMLFVWGLSLVNAQTVSAPSNLQISLATTTATLTWIDNSSNETSFYIERSSNGGTTWTQLKIVSVNITQYIDNTLACHSTYHYRVRAFGWPYSNYSNVAATTTGACGQMIAPENLTLEVDLNWGISLQWENTNGNATQKRIERSNDNGLTWLEIEQIHVSYTSYDDNSLCGGDYLYRLRDYRSYDTSYSPYSDEVAGNFPCAEPLAEEICGFTQVADYGALGGLRLSLNPNLAFIYDTDGSTVVYDIDTGTFLDWAGGGKGMSADVSESGLYFFADIDNEYYQQLFLWEDGVRTALTSNSNSDVYYGLISTSSDGTVTVFAEYTDWYLTDLSHIWLWEEGLGIREILPEINNLSQIVVSGDGQNIVFVSTDDPISEDPNHYGLVYRYDGTSISSFGALPAELADGVLYADYLSTDNDASHIAFLGVSEYSEISHQGLADIYLWTEEQGFISLLGADKQSYDGLDPMWKNYNLVASGWTANGNRFMFMSEKDLVGSNPEGSLEVFFYEDGVVQQVTTSFDVLDAQGIPMLENFAISADGSHILTYTMLPQPVNPTDFENAEALVVFGTCDPATPSSPELTASDSTSTSISLSWDDNSNSETEYRLERSDDGISWAEIAQPIANSTGYTDTGLPCGTAYDYRIRAYRSDDTSYSAYSNVVTGTTDDCLPLVAPTGLMVTGTSQTSVSLSWTDNDTDETSYSLERSVDSGTSWTEIQALAANSTSYTDNGLNCNATYDYRVRAYRSGDTSYSGYSNNVTGTTTACPAPLAPTDLTVTATTQTSVSLAWTDNASDETSYSLERSADNGASWTEIAQPATDSTSYNDTTALCNTSYDYRVRVYRAGDNQFSDYSNVVTGTTDICITLNAPTDIQQTANSETGMSLSWTDNSTNESGYEIERSLDGTNWVLLSSLPADSTSDSDSGLTCSTGYQYRIRSNHLGTATYSPYGGSGILTTAACPALIPSVLSSTDATQSSISLSWTVDTNATSFTLAYYNGTSWVNLGIFPSTTTTYTHSGLICGRNYPYQVTTFRAADSASVTSSAFATSTSACPPLAAPNAPVVVNTEPALVSLQIPAMPATATSMSLEVSTDGVSWTNLGNVSSNYLDTSVVCGGSYQYRLVALRSSDGVTSTSVTAVAFTDACPIPTVVGVYRNGLWVFVASNNTATPVNSFNFGDATWQALVGDWDGDGIDGLGIYRNGEFALRNVASADSPENRFNFGHAEAGWTAIVGDWNGDGIDSVGLYKDGLFILSDDNSNIQYRFNFGFQQAGWQAVAGDWDGNGADGIGLYKDGLWQFANDVNNPDASSFSINYGPAQAGWVAIVGDWNGDGMDSIGLYGNSIWRMRVNSVNDVTETSLNFGQTGDIPLAIFEN